MKKLLPLLAILLALIQPLHAKQILAVLEIIPTADASVSISEAQHITNELRRQATLTLPQDFFMVLTRDNLVSLMPQDEAEADRLIESGAIGIGKAIGASYVTQGYIKVFDKFLSLSVELYNTESGGLVGNVVVEASDAMGLLKSVRESSQVLFAKIEKPIPQKIPEPISTLIPPPAPSSIGSFWTAKNTLRVIALTLSAASLGVGIWQNGKMKSNIEKANKLAGAANTYDLSSPEYHENYEANSEVREDIKFNKNMRKGLYMSAGAFGVAGVVTFFF
jgi:hypothetical protein